MDKSRVELGDRVKDRITGFQGIVVAVTSWLTGCDRFCVQPEKLNKEGAVPSNETFDEVNLQIVKKQVVKPLVKAVPSLRAQKPVDEPGGPRPAPRALPRTKR